MVSELVHPRTSDCHSIQKKEKKRTLILQPLNMELSEEIASLSVQMQKLTAAVSNLVLARTLQGTFDMSKLPMNCLTTLKLDHLVRAEQQVFDEIPPPSSQVPANDLCQNQVHKPSTEGITNSTTFVIQTHQVFDDTPTPILNLNSDQVGVIGDEYSLLNDINKLQLGVNDVSEPKIEGIVPDYVRTVNSLLHKMHVPDFILEMAAKTTHENEEMADEHQVFDTMPEPTAQANASKTICQAAMINNEVTPSKVLDEFPHRHSPLLHASEGLNIIRKQDDLKEHNDHVTLSIFFSSTDTENEVLYWCQKNMDFKGFMCNMMFGSIFSRVCVFLPVLFLHMNSAEIHFHTIYYFEVINGWKSQVNYKEIQSWGKLLVGLIWTERFQNRSQLPSIHYIDAYCLFPSAPNNHGRVDTFYCTLIYDLIEDTDTYWLIGHYKFHTLGFVEVLSMLLHLVLKLENDLPFCKHFIRSESFGLGVSKPVFFCNLTPEDKGDFEEVGNNSVLALRRTRKHAVHLTISCHTLAVTTVYLFGVDLVGVKYEFCPSVRYVSIVIFWVFDPGGNGDLLRCTTTALIVSDGSGTGLVSKFYAKSIFFMTSNGDLRLSMHLYVQQHWNFTWKCLLVNEERRSSCSTIHLRNKVHFDDLDVVYEGILLGRRSVDVKRMTNTGFLTKRVVCTLVGVTNYFIFDPGGYDNGLSEQPKAKRYENHQAYVFDPGGSLLCYVISKSEIQELLQRPMEAIVLSITLEDKGVLKE